MATTHFSLSAMLNGANCCPWTASAGFAARRPSAPQRQTPALRRQRIVYTPERAPRRAEGAWTLVQGVLAPLQFLAFAVSLGLVLHFLASGSGYAAATISIVVKTGFLYAIMTTGALWERAVFGRLLFAPAFFWEDAFSMLVIALHTGYVAALLTHALAPSQLMLLALTAYASYVVNAAQFVVKFRAVRREAQPWAGSAAGPAE